MTYSDLVLATVRLYTQDSKRPWSTRTLLKSSVKGLIFFNQYYLIEEKRKPELFLFGYLKSGNTDFLADTNDGFSLLNYICGNRRVNCLNG